jgi:hypothetical protein
MKASELRLGRPQCMLFKGPFGFGKTLAAASYALDGPVYLSYWDKKDPIELLTYFTKKRFGVVAEQILDNITFDVYSADNAGEYLNKMLSFRDECRYFAIVNDSLTFMTSSAVHWSLNFDQKSKLIKKLKDIIPDWDEYKVETSLVTQCLELSKKLPCHVIWTAHPMPTTKVEGSGSSMRVTKINPLVSYGAKVAGLIPGGFTEIYHFSQKANWDAQGAGSKQFICNLEAMGDEFAKSPLLGHSIKELDFTDKLFYQVWKEAIAKASGLLLDEPKANTDKPESSLVNPFKTEQPAQTTKWKV